MPLLGLRLLRKVSWASKKEPNTLKTQKNSVWRLAGSRGGGSPTETLLGSSGPPPPIMPNHPNLPQIIRSIDEPSLVPFCLPTRPRKTQRQATKWQAIKRHTMSSPQLMIIAKKVLILHPRTHLRNPDNVTGDRSDKKLIDKKS